jgi:hypothetical protein
MPVLYARIKRLDEGIERARLAGTINAPAIGARRTVTALLRGPLFRRTHNSSPAIDPMYPPPSADPHLAVAEIKPYKKDQ